MAVLSTLNQGSQVIYVLMDTTGSYQQKREGRVSWVQRTVAMVETLKTQYPQSGVVVIFYNDICAAGCGRCLHCEKVIECIDCSGEDEDVVSAKVSAAFASATRESRTGGDSPEALGLALDLVAQHVKEKSVSSGLVVVFGDAEPHGYAGMGDNHPSHKELTFKAIRSLEEQQVRLVAFLPQTVQTRRDIVGFYNALATTLGGFVVCLPEADTVGTVVGYLLRIDEIHEQVVNVDSTKIPFWVLYYPVVIAHDVLGAYLCVGGSYTTYLRNQGLSESLDKDAILVEPLEDQPAKPVLFGAGARAALGLPAVEAVESEPVRSHATASAASREKYRRRKSHATGTQGGFY